MNTFVKNNSLLISNKRIIYPLASNSANWYQRANWNGTTIGSLTTVGINGGPSAYGTYDQSGNVEEHLENYSGSSNFMFRHSSSFDDTVNTLTFNDGLIANVGINITSALYGFRISSYTNPYNYSNLVDINDPNNIAASNGYGSISYLFKMGKYLVTNNDYITYLIAIATVDPSSGSKVYDNEMRNNIRGGINRTLVSGSGNSSVWSYNIRSNMGNKPVNFVSWYMAARYMNWLHNGKPSGAQNTSTTEDGAYDMTLTIPIRKNNARYFIPNISEWTKAGFYKGGSGNSGYWLYATQTDFLPIPVYAISTGDAIIPTIVLGNLQDYTRSTNLNITGPTARDKALGFRTNSDSKLKLSSIVLGSPGGTQGIVSIFSDSGGVPGSLLFSSPAGANSIINPSNLSNSYITRYYFNNVTLSPNTTYWVRRSGQTTDRWLYTLNTNIVNTPIPMNSSSYSFVDILILSGGIWSSYNPGPGLEYNRNLGFSLECY